MVVLNKIYTRTGDKGDTALGDGSRVAKDDARVDAYGTVDELNAILGLARLPSDAATVLDAQLMMIQNDLFDLGADLCVPLSDAPKEYEELRMSGAQVLRLEAEIDAMTAVLDPLRSFILPGGSAAAAHLHHARTVARRAERMVVSLAANQPINEQVLIYLNRLSDWLFCAARMANDQGRSDILWVAGANR